MEKFYSLISIVPSWLGVMGTRGKWLSKILAFETIANARQLGVFLVS